MYHKMDVMDVCAILVLFYINLICCQSNFVYHPSSVEMNFILQHHTFAFRTKWDRIIFQITWNRGICCKTVYSENYNPYDKYIWQALIRINFSSSPLRLMANLLKVVILYQFVSGTSWFEATACIPIDISMPTTVSDMTKFPNIVGSRYNGCSFSGGFSKYGILNINCCIICIKFLPKGPINTLRPRQNGRYFPDDIFKGMFLNENDWISIKISMKLIGMKLMRKSIFLLV